MVNLLFDWLKLGYESQSIVGFVLMFATYYYVVAKLHLSIDHMVGITLLDRAFQVYIESRILLFSFLRLKTAIKFTEISDDSLKFVKLC